MSKKTERERFEERINKTETCWLWTGWTRDGYGRYDTPTVDGVRYKTAAHRYAYELFVGPIPEGSVVHHRCANRVCVNPDHLQLTTQHDNAAEMLARRAYVARIAALETQVDALTARILELEAQAAKP